MDMRSSSSPIPKAVLFDRDGTLVQDVPYNGDPGLVAPVPDARQVLAELRGRGIATGVVSNQSGVARGLLSRSQVDLVNDRIDHLIGPFDIWEICPHGTEDGCGCRKPAPGMILSACRRLGIAAADAAYIGDIGSDMEAAAAAGVRGILVPTALTRPEEVAAAREVAADLSGAVSLLLGQAPMGGRQ